MWRIRIFRFLVRLIPVLLWRSKPRNLLIRDIPLAVDGGTITLRIYTPQGRGPFPVTLYFHGGGFVVGSIDSCDPICRGICTGAGHIVVSVDYRLAPEHPFPAAANDCLATLQWLAHNLGTLNAQPGKVFVAGDSAGGNLAAVVAQQARTTLPGLLRGQVLIFPVTHHYCHQTASYREFSAGGRLMRWFWDTYYQNNVALPAGHFTHPLSTPLAMDDLSNLPPALVIICGKDPLRDESREYAEKMAAQGVTVQQGIYADAEHGFIGYMGPTEKHRKGMAEITAWLKTYSL